MANTDPNRDSGDLSALTATPVLVTDREQFRDLVLNRVASISTELGRNALEAGYQQTRSGVQKFRVARLESLRGDLETCFALLAQVGWRG